MASLLPLFAGMRGFAQQGGATPCWVLFSIGPPSFLFGQLQAE
jgi:hypothetical protein